MNTQDKIYIAGHRGMVGSAIERKLRGLGFNNIISKTSKELDLRNQQQVNDFSQLLLNRAVAGANLRVFQNLYRVELNFAG